MTEIILTAICPFCGNHTNVKVFEEDYVRWQEGELVQNCFPYLSATEREVLISITALTNQVEVVMFHGSVS